MKTIWPLLKKVIICLLLGFALFTYSNLIQRELLVADNKGEITITSAGKKIDDQTFFTQYIRRININGRNLDPKQIKVNEWATHSVDIVNVVYSTPKASSIIIQHDQPVKSVSFEYQTGTTYGNLQVYVDNHLVHDINANQKKTDYKFTSFSLPQSFGISQQNYYWYLILTLFILGSFLFVVRGLYDKLRIWGLIKFSALVYLFITSLYMALDYFSDDSLSVFNSTIFAQDLIALAFLTPLFLAISFMAIRDLLPKRLKQVIKLPYFLVYSFPPFLAFYLMENTYSSMSMLDPKLVPINLWILAWLYLGLSWITTSIKAGGSLLILLATLFGVFNRILIDLRQQPLLFYHLLQLKDGLNVANSSKITLDNSTLQSIFLAWIGISVIVFLPRTHFRFLDKFNKPKPRWQYLAQGLAKRMLIFATGFFFVSQVLPEQIKTLTKEADIGLNHWRMQSTYAKSGSPLSFLSFYLDSQITKPNGYSKQAVDKILQAYQKEEASDSKKKLPNILLIQNESQADFLSWNLPISEDPMAFQRSLKENTIHGQLNVSVYGGGTANTEYEVITSNSLALLSSNVFPYQQLIDGPKNNFTRLMNASGYKTVGTHPQAETNYNRKNVYRDFGFSEAYFLDSKPSYHDLQKPSLLRSYVSDESLVDSMITLLENKGDQPLFNFVITMQGHGGYAVPTFPEPVLMHNSAKPYPAESEYFSSVRASDQALKKLITYLQDFDEPTVVIMYGDHQPLLSPGFYENFMPKNSGDKLVDYSAKYITPFVIWANFDIPEKTDAIISPNFLVPYAISSLSQSSNPIPSSAYYRFLTEQQKRVPVMTTWGYRTPDGKYHENLKDDKLISDYRLVEYYNVMEKLEKNKFFE